MKHLLPLIFLLLFIVPLTSQTASSTRTSWNDYGVGRDRPINIEVFPNPATTHISLTDVEGVNKVVLYNLVGRKMREFEDIGRDVRHYVGDLPRGMYLVQILGNDNRILTTRRISKQ